MMVRSNCWMQKTTRWWFRIFVYFHHIFTSIWGRFPFWRAYFSNGLKPANQPTNPTQPNPTQPNPTNPTNKSRGLWMWGGIGAKWFSPVCWITERSRRRKRGRHRRRLVGMDGGWWPRDLGVFPVFSTLCRKGKMGHLPIYFKGKSQVGGIFFQFWTVDFNEIVLLKFCWMMVVFSILEN